VLFTLNTVLDGSDTADASQVFWCWEKNRSIMTRLAITAPHKLKKQQHTNSIHPCQWFPSRTVNFIVSAVWAALPSDFLSFHVSETLIWPLAQPHSYVYVIDQWRAKSPAFRSSSFATFSATG
jgi:hypothetical protein